MKVILPSEWDKSDSNSIKDFFIESLRNNNLILMNRNNNRSHSGMKCLRKGEKEPDELVS